jgi:hypothetical protein
MISYAQKMFNLQGLDEYVTDQFISRFQRLKKMPQKEAIIGTIDISSYINEIFAFHGKPKNKEFFTSLELRINTNPQLSKYFKAAFYQKTNKYCLVIYVGENSSISKEKLLEDVGHEMQHLVLFIYNPKETPKYSAEELSNDQNIGKHYYDSSEIQAYCAEISDWIMKNVKLSYQMLLDRSKHNKINICEHFRNKDSSFFRSLVIGHCKVFFQDINYPSPKGKGF